MVCPPGWRWGWGGVGGGANCRKRGYIDIVLEIEYSQLSLRPTPLGPTPSVRFRESNKGSKLKTGPTLGVCHTEVSILTGVC